MRFIGKQLIILALGSAALALSAGAQQQTPSRLAQVPGAQTLAAAMASSSDGLSRYLAPDGPIQPALSAIGGLPLRGAELANRGITQISARLDSGAQGLSRAAGQDGNIRMPGLDAMESAMPASLASLGQSMQGAIRSKNNFIRGQAEAGVQAGERLRSMWQNGLKGMSVRSSGLMAGAGNLLGDVQGQLARGGEQLRGQLQRSMSGHMDRMQGVSQLGENVRGQAQGIGRAISNGLSGASDSLRSAGQQVLGQLQSGHQQNQRAVEGMLGSMQGSLSGLGQNMQKGLGDVQGALQKAAALPMGVAQQLGSQLGNSLGGLMSKGGAAMPSMAGGRY